MFLARVALRAHGGASDSTHPHERSSAVLSAHFIC